MANMIMTVMDGIKVTLTDGSWQHLLCWIPAHSVVSHFSTSIIEKVCNGNYPPTCQLPIIPFQRLSPTFLSSSRFLLGKLNRM